MLGKCAETFVFSVIRILLLRCSNSHMHCARFELVKAQDHVDFLSPHQLTPSISITCASANLVSHFMCYSLITVCRLSFTSSPRDLIFSLLSLHLRLSPLHATVVPSCCLSWRKWPCRLAVLQQEETDCLTGVSLSVCKHVWICLFPPFP